MRVGADLADEEVDGVFGYRLDGWDAFWHWRDFIRAVGLLIND